MLSLFSLILYTLVNCLCVCIKLLQGRQQIANILLLLYSFFILKSMRQINNIPNSNVKPYTMATPVDDVGDGDFVMSASAIWTAAHYQVPLLIVINNNNSWGNDEHHQIRVARARNRPPENAWIGQRMIDPDIDFATVAKGFGAWSEGPVTDPGALAGVFAEAVKQVEQGKVAVIDVRTAL